MSYSLTAIDPNIAEPIDLTTRLESCTFAYDRHGCADLSATIRMPLLEQYRFYNASAARDVFVSWNGGAIWRGRMERCAVGSTTMEITAAGNWRDLLDTPYTALWSTTSVEDFRPVTRDEVPTADPAKFQFDTQNRLFIGLQKNASYGNSPWTVGEFAYITPDQGSRTIQTFSFDYEVNLPVGWTMRWGSWTSNFVTFTSIGTLAATGAVQTGSISATVSSAPIVIVDISRGAANALYAGETGDSYAKFTNLRIKTTSAATVLSSAIVSDLVSATVLNSRVTTTSLDLRDEVYEDMYPGEIIDHLAELESYRAYVDLANTVVYESAGVVREPTWLISAADVSVERALDKLYNARYAIYKDASGRTLRTASASNAISTAQYGITRTAPVGANTTSSSQATTIRDTALADTAQVPARARFGVRRLTDWFGQLAPLHMPQPGDSASLVNLPPIADAAIDSPRSFVIGRTEVRIGRGKRPSITIEPEDPAPSLSVYLARIAEGI